MFRFNFNVENDTNIYEPNPLAQENDNQEEQKCNPANEIITPENLSMDEYSFKPISVESYSFLIRDFENDKDCYKEDEFLSKYYSTCDVTPSIYEGGLKIWECTYDLLLYLIHNEIDFKNKTVLDLGCGCGILGIYAAKREAQIVHFHDYNTDVLKKFTAPNVTRNEIKSNTLFIGGDWGSFCNLPSTESTTYDYILSSETLYNPSSYSKLSEIFSKKLSKNGQILIASKSYYFGVGGNTKQFLEHLRQEQKFEWSVMWRNGEGVLREIISITLGKTPA